MYQGKIKTTLFFVVTLLLLSACGGGGGGSKNAAPTVSGIVSSSADETVADYTISTAELLANASDANGDALSVTGLSVSSGDASGVTTNANTVDVSPGAYSALRGGMSEVIVVNFNIEDGKGGSVATSLEITVSGVNLETPVANAGSNQTAIDIASTVSLDGSASSDGDGDPLTYRWTIVSAPPTSTATLSDAAIANPSFTPDVDGSYLFSLIVNDGNLDSESANVGIATSASSAPIARVGTGINVDSYNRITENGLDTELVAWDSFDADGDTLYFHWTLDRAPTASVAVRGETVTTTGAYSFLPDTVGVYTFTLAVDDGVLAAAEEIEVTVTALDSSQVFTSADSFPLAIPDNDVVTGVSSTIEVSGAPTSLDYVRVSVNLEHQGPTNQVDIFLESPVGTMIELSTDNQYLFNNRLQASTDLVLDNYLGVGVLNATPAPVIFVPEQSLDTLDGEDANGTWVLHVYDDTANNIGSLIDWHLVFPGLPAIANAGADQTLAAGTNEVVTVDGSASIARSGNPLTYTWSFAEVPAGSVVSLDDANAVMPSFTPDLGGNYILELVVTDGIATSLQDTVTITAQLPSATITAPGRDVLLVNTAETINLDGSASSTISGGTLTYSWQLAAVPSGSAAVIESPTSATPNFTTDLVGDYIVELVVNDGFASSEAATLRVVVPDMSTTYNSADSFPIAITDRNTFTTTIMVSGGVSEISFVSVYMDITHTFDADLDIFLIAPSGQRVMLTTDNGGSGNNFTDTIFNDLATRSVVGGSTLAPFTGYFRPEEPLSVLEGLDANGIWTLEVTDDAGADQGTLNSWQLEFIN